MGYASKSAAFRRAMMQAVTPADISEIVKMQVFLARKGDALATREILDRCVGKPASIVEIMEIEAGDSETRRIGMTSLTPAGADAEMLTMIGTVPYVPEDPRQLAAPVEADADADADDEAVA